MSLHKLMRWAADRWGRGATDPSIHPPTHPSIHPPPRRRTHLPRAVLLLGARQLLVAVGRGLGPAEALGLHLHLLVALGLGVRHPAAQQARQVAVHSRIKARIRVSEPNQSVASARRPTLRTHIHIHTHTYTRPSTRASTYRASRLPRTSWERRADSRRSMCAVAGSSVCRACVRGCVGVSVDPMHMTSAERVEAGINTTKNEPRGW